MASARDELAVREGGFGAAFGLLTLAPPGAVGVLIPDDPEVRLEPRTL